jgi:hypothetical protein
LEREAPMNEYIEITFRKPGGQRLRVKRQVAGGIEFEERDPIERTVGFQFKARSAATEFRMRRIAQVKGWDPGLFKLIPSVEDGNIVLRGVDQDALPEGLYELRVEIEEAETAQTPRNVDVDHDGHGNLTLEVRQDDRTVACDLSSCDADIKRVLDASTIDGHAAMDWFDEDWRPTRKACLLNLLATLRVSPEKTNNLLKYVQRIEQVFNDRIYMKVDLALKTRVDELVKNEKKLYYAEGSPLASIHRHLLDAIPSEEKPGFSSLLSYRGEGSPSLQMVLAVPPVGLAHTYGDFDLDLANPLQDVLGFITHVGELLSGKPTNHLDLRRKLAKGKASDFLYYTIA